MAFGGGARFQFKHGDWVRITGGNYEGQEAIIDTLVGVTQGDDGNWNGEIGYNAKLNEGRYVTVQWDRVTKLG
jgi:ABC-type transport system involved in cytochrome c biogenesis ATPase subunit